MMPSTLLTLLVLTQGAPVLPPVSGAGAPSGAPALLSTAQLYFVAGDLRRATEYIDQCLRTREKPSCVKVKKALVEYTYLASRRDSLTADQARQMIAFDRQVGATERSKVTQVVLEQWVRRPVRLAQARCEAGLTTEAATLLTEALAVDATDADALSLKTRCAGLARDAGLAPAK